MASSPKLKGNLLRSIYRAKLAPYTLDKEPEISENSFDIQFPVHLFDFEGKLPQMTAIDIPLKGVCDFNYFRGNPNRPFSYMQDLLDKGKIDKFPDTCNVNNLMKKIVNLRKETRQLALKTEIKYLTKTRINLALTKYSKNLNTVNDPNVSIKMLMSFILDEILKEETIFLHNFVYDSTKVDELPSDEPLTKEIIFNTLQRKESSESVVPSSNLKFRDSLTTPYTMTNLFAADYENENVIYLD